MISKHLLISIFLVTSLFAGSKTKRDKGKSDSKPSSDDSKDIVHKSKWTPREGKLGGEGGKKEDAADEAGVSTEGGNETPKVNRLMENAGESDEEAEHPEGSQREESQGAEEEEGGEEEEAEKDEVSNHTEEDRHEEEEGEEYEPKEESADDAEPKRETEKEEPKREAEESDDEGKNEGDEPKGESPCEAVVEESKVEAVDSDAHETCSSASKASEELDGANDAAASAPPADWTYSSPGTAFEGLKIGDKIQVYWGDDWYDAKFLQVQPNGDLRVKFMDYGGKPRNINIRQKKANNYHQIRKRN